MGYALDRMDPAVMEKAQCETLLRVLESGSALVGTGGERFEMPEPLARFIARAAEAMRRGQSVALVPDKAVLTTQEAADYMGFSRPFLIGLLEKGEIPFHMTGTHRKILFSDLRAYEERRDVERHKILTDLFDELDEAGLYWLGLDELVGKQE